MKQGQKEYYKRDYAQAKAEGKPFFPYAIYKDHLIALLAVAAVIAMAIWQRMEVGDPVDPATESYDPRPEWYFLFLFQLLKIFKGQDVFTPVIMATFIVPNVLMGLLIALPFIDRGPERRLNKRPVAVATAILVVISLVYLTHKGSQAGAGGEEGITFTNLTPEAEAGMELFLTSGCTSCHQMKGVGSPGPGPNLSSIGTVANVPVINAPISADNAKQFLQSPPPAMPPFANFSDKEYQELGAFLGGVGEEFK
ncbi:MAG TPA: c-type cytochrome [Miltoncostaeaceae bacterium]|nr:c-type cytochrome [Miltoncostaeaceae bacterium]